MSASTDLDDVHQLNKLLSSTTLLEHRMTTIGQQRLNPKVHLHWFDRSERKIFFSCLTLLIVYWTFFTIASPLLTTIHSKEEYFLRELRRERDEIVRSKLEFDQNLTEWKSKCDLNNLTCRKCYFLLLKIDSQQVHRIFENNQPIKAEYDADLSPLQSLSIILCLFNTMVIIFVFEKAILLFLLSNLLLIVCLGINAELFIRDCPSVFYTLIIAISILLFTIFLLMKVLQSLFIVRHYREIRTTVRDAQ